MKKIIRNIFLLLVLSFSFSQVVFSQSLNYVDKNTALRYLKLSQDYMVKSQWDSVLSYAEIGLTYDDTVADLWYLKAISLEQNREKPYLIIENLEKSLDTEWNVYNKNGAKLLLADYYAHTLNYKSALNLLDDKSLLLNSEALKIKAKIYYLTGEISKAREAISTGWRVFPTDPDYPKIFYTYEDSALLNNVDENLDDITYSVTDELFYQLNNQFLTSIYDFITVRNRYDGELLLLASSFADKDLQEQILKVYKTQGIDNPLYPIKALEANIILPEDAIDSFFALSDQKINYNYLEQLVKLIPENEKKSIVAFLDAYEGEIYFDNNNDGIFELKSIYKNGRPSYAEYEFHQDGNIFWSCDFDYGTPRKVYIPSEPSNITFIYARYPFVSKIETDFVDINLVPDSVKGLPFEVVKSDFLLDVYDFYLPMPTTNTFELPNMFYNINSITFYNTAKGQYGEDKVRFSLSNGKIVSGNYYLDNVLYASAIFEEGELLFRNIDKDYDGVFEMTEIYTNLDKSHDFQSNVDKKNIFGSLDYEKDIWLSSISIDMNSDGEIDFREEYFQDGRIVKTWEGVTQVNNQNGDLISVTFKNPINNLDVLVNYKEGKPINFEYNDYIYNLVYDQSLDMYFISYDPKTNYSIDFDKIKQDLQNKKSSYSVILYEIGDARFCAIKTFDFYFLWNLI